MNARDSMKRSALQYLYDRLSLRTVALELEMSDAGRRTPVDDKIRVGLIQAMVPYELRLGDVEKRQQLLYRAVFGDELAPGLKAQVEGIDVKVDQLLKQQEERADDWKKMREFLDGESDRQAVLKAVARVGWRSWQVAVGVVGLLGAIVGLVGGLIALGFIKW